MGTMVQIGAAVQLGYNEVLQYYWSGAHESDVTLTAAVNRPRSGSSNCCTITVQVGLAEALDTIGIWICPMITGFRKWGGKKLIEHMDLVNQSSKSNKIKMLYVQII
ncbi:hypothetical protein RhiirC2_709927 [Rhizophagus irregularis]|uniref:Uncharacterized protein n=1 Tax=Rhizophagus irregularis TaxID=588596 RepID=A0A2N1NGM1_9GLOM|nr:hypothetical protein RhiirC2_709927 [Rhizophagus irregularis]